MHYESRQLPIRSNSFVGAVTVIFLESLRHPSRMTEILSSEEDEMVAISAKGKFNLPDDLAGLPTQEICAKAESSLGARSVDGNITIYSYPNSDLPAEIPSP